MRNLRETKTKFIVTMDNRLILREINKLYLGNPDSGNLERLTSRR